MKKKNIDITITAHPALLSFWAEEYECAMMYLNDRNVPKVKDGQDLSLVGRIEEYARNKDLYVKAN